MIPKILIDVLKLKPHPEGGMYSETYRSNINIHLSETSYEDGTRSLSTAIYFALDSNDCSSFHKLRSDETWYFHEGSSLKVHVISEDGTCEEFILGNLTSDLNARPQITIPAGKWFAAEVIEVNSYSLVSCSVYPGFDFRDFTLAKRKELYEYYPKFKELIDRFTREEF